MGFRESSILEMGFRESSILEMGFRVGNIVLWGSLNGSFLPYGIMVSSNSEHRLGSQLLESNYGVLAIVCTNDITQNEMTKISRYLVIKIIQDFGAILKKSSQLKIERMVQFEDPVNLNLFLHHP